MQDFHKIIAASETDRRDLFLSTATRLGTTLENVEKDFWICWVLKFLFEMRQPNEPRLLFKGGTSLSKAYGLISRFSEDIDITVFREDIGQNIQTTDLNQLSRKKQKKYVDDIRNACQNYIQTELYSQLNKHIDDTFKSFNIKIENPVTLDPSDLDQQTILIHYPSVIKHATYIAPSVKIEAGAKSAFDPHQLANFTPYCAPEIDNMDLKVNNVVTINPERTFWDKVIILHGLRAWFDNRKEIMHQGNRISRHYYDIYKLINSTIGQQIHSNHVLASECSQHAKIFFHRTPLNLDSAKPGSYLLTPTNNMINGLARDYKAMSTMIFGDVPNFDDIVESVSRLEEKLNQTDS